MDDLGDFIAFDAFFPGGGASSGGSSSGGGDGKPNGRGCGDGCLVLILFIIVMCFSGMFATYKQKVPTSLLAWALWDLVVIQMFVRE